MRTKHAQECEVNMREKPFSKFQILANLTMIIWTLIVILPFLLLFMSSVTDENTLVANGYSFFPAKFSLAAYTYIIRSGEKILKAYGISILVTVAGTFLNVLLSALMAYPLSIKKLPGKNLMNFFVFFTMLFNGGIVPAYLMWTGTFHIKDTIWAQLLPNLLLSAWNVMMIRTYFITSIPESLYEAAEIDGAPQLKIFSSIVIPLGKPILVTMGTFAGLTYWNDWTNGLYFIVKNQNLYNVQNLLNQMVSNIQFLASSTSSNVTSAAASLPSTAIQMAIAFVAILPIMLIFPSFQKYYSKGLTLGGVKG
jgi:ABC-type sugar transport system, permease component